MVNPQFQERSRALKIFCVIPLSVKETSTLTHQKERKTSTQSLESFANPQVDRYTKHLNSKSELEPDLKPDLEPDTKPNPQPIVSEASDSEKMETTLSVLQN